MNNLHWDSRKTGSLKLDILKISGTRSSLPVPAACPCSSPRRYRNSSFYSFFCFLLPVPFLSIHSATQVSQRGFSFSESSLACFSEPFLSLAWFLFQGGLALSLHRPTGVLPGQRPARYRKRNFGCARSAPGLFGYPGCRRQHAIVPWLWSINCTIRHAFPRLAEPVASQQTLWGKGCGRGGKGVMREK